jgi:hypothetical protein
MLAIHVLKEPLKQKCLQNFAASFYNSYETNICVEDKSLRTVNMIGLHESCIFSFKTEMQKTV